MVAEISPTIQITAFKIVHQDYSFADIGRHFGISKQAVSEHLKAGIAYFKNYKKKGPSDEEIALAKALAELKKKEELIRSLRRQLILKSAIIFLLTLLKNRIKEFFPNFKVTRLAAFEKKQILDLWAQFSRMDGELKEFCKAIERSPNTIRDWLKRYEREGLGGLADKTTRPKHFANKIPLWLKDQLKLLFKKFPNWTPYQFYKYIQSHPAFSYRIALGTITKLRAAYMEYTEQTKALIKNAWAFAPNYEVWAVDFTNLFKTSCGSLQLLTITDQRSRFLLSANLCLETSTQFVVDQLEELFIKHGKPLIIKADNGPEFRMDCRESLNALGVYLLNNPNYYAPFNGKHERMHRTLKDYIEDFRNHRNLSRLVREIDSFREEYNYEIPLEVLNLKTPAEIYFSDPDFMPKEETEIIRPYEKDGELRMKFTRRNGTPGRIALPLLKREA